MRHDRFIATAEAHGVDLVDIIALFNHQFPQFDNVSVISSLYLSISYRLPLQNASSEAKVTFAGDGHYCHDRQPYPDSRQG